MLRVLFLGTPEFAVEPLEAISKKHQIIEVVTQPDRPAGRGLGILPPPIKKKAQQLGLPVFQVEKILPEHHKRFEAMNIDVAVVVAFGQILKTKFIKMPRLGCVNLHSSLLPRWRGAAPIHWALLSGDVETGVTVMRIVEKLDAGNILLTKKTPISCEDTVTILHDRLAHMGAQAMIEALDLLESGHVKELEQEEALVTYATKLTKEMQWLDLTQSAEVLDRKIRALNPWPGTSVRIKDRGRLKIKAAGVQAHVNVAPGQIVEKNGMILLGSSSGALELKKLQWEGKPSVGPAEFLNGLKGQGLGLPLATI